MDWDDCKGTQKREINSGMRPREIVQRIINTIPKLESVQRKKYPYPSTGNLIGHYNSEAAKD